MQHSLACAALDKGSCTADGFKLTHTASGVLSTLIVACQLPGCCTGMCVLHQEAGSLATTDAARACALRPWQCLQLTAGLGPDAACTGLCSAREGQLQLQLLATATAPKLPRTASRAPEARLEPWPLPASCQAMVHSQHVLHQDSKLLWTTSTARA